LDKGIGVELKSKKFICNHCTESVVLKRGEGFPEGSDSVPERVNQHCPECGQTQRLVRKDVFEDIEDGDESNGGGGDKDGDEDGGKGGERS
jgi:RNase P subunit RPR2